MADLPPLAQFLRSRRERVDPASIGLKTNGRRRTPGLRREEVATLAGVSIDYLVRLEQGRDANPSPEVLLALADALQLDRMETGHLMALVQVGLSPRLEAFCPASSQLDAAVPAPVRTILDQMGLTPALVVGPLGDVIASNVVWRAAAAPLGLGDGDNLARHVFLRPELYPDHDEVADAEVARLRTAQLYHGDDPRLEAIVAELSTLPEFTRRWNGRATSGSSRGRLRLQHPEAGELHFDYEVMRLASDDQRLVCWVPANAAAQSVVDQAAGSAEAPVSPARLRVVGEA